MTWFVKAAVIHHTLNTLGGETTVAIDAIESLHELGYEVDLITVQPPDLERVAKAYGKDLQIKHMISLLPFKANYFGMYQKLMTVLLSSRIHGADIVLNTHGDLLPYHIEGSRQISYVHFPAFLLTSSEEFRNWKYENSLFWRAYFKPYQSISSFLAKRAARNNNNLGLVLVNSAFSKNAIKKVFPDIDVRVLYPPVDTDRFSNACDSDIADGSQVLTVSRFSPEKQIENAIKVALLLPDTRFEIAGALMRANTSYFKSLQNMIERHGLGNRVRLKPNATNEELLDSMSKSSVYLHTMAGEHFGMSIVEAMSAGLVPVVPSYGGCSEIVPAEYQYGTVREAADRIARIIDSGDHSKTARRRMRNMAMRFSSKEFKKEIKKYIEQVKSVPIEAGKRSQPAEAA
ncbi:glycosyltransferase [Candidatus Nitrososphaera gargensis]|uniref:glycosyltransferase n=1 Tax=Candidatus Nitrososphaera gargensis TaxID=497727 RepID=UPI0011E516C4|nr:glycosyltransferase [Candidatus Nitrososphaera gargensis]